VNVVSGERANRTFVTLFYFSLSLKSEPKAAAAMFPRPQ
jgi:hypothetical protein